MHSQIFISYRREDTSASAGRFHDHLSARFAPDQIFMDVDNLEPGVDFVDAIEKSVSSCDVLIAVIGKHWLTSSDEEGQRRLDNPEDYVRIEIATALKRDIRVIPVLVDGASIPKPRDLPDDLKSFVRRSAIEAGMLVSGMTANGCSSRSSGHWRQRGLNSSQRRMGLDELQRRP
jgi:TIR domain